MWLLTFLAGAKRWFSKDTFFAIGLALVITAGIGFSIAIYRDIKKSAGLTERLRCVEAVADGNEQAAEEIDRLNANMVAAAQRERDKAKAEAKQGVTRAVSLEQALNELKDDPVCYPKTLARSLRQ